MDWVDPLIVTDAKGKPCHVLRNMLSGRGALLVCGGPSLNNLPMERIRERGIYSLGVNNAAATYRTNAFVAGDHPRRFHQAIYDDPTMDKFLPLEKILDPNKSTLRRMDEHGKFHEHVRRTGDCPRVWGFEMRGWIRTETDMWFTETGATWGNKSSCAKKMGAPKTCNTMFFGIRLLQYLGARKIYMLGVDFGMDPDKEVGNYAWGQGKPIRDINKCNWKFGIAAQWLTELRPLFERFGFEVFNCNESSNLKAFDYRPFDEALEVCRGDVPKDPLNLAGWYERNR